MIGWLKETFREWRKKLTVISVMFEEIFCYRRNNGASLSLNTHFTI